MKTSKKILIGCIVLWCVYLSVDMILDTKKNIENAESYKYEYDSLNTTSNGGSHYVRSYTRKDGTVVKGHYRN